ncbi:hypothetical protein PLEOSDRAFT_152885 [Pleurotus ostreatus PC15]|uniref:Ubiquitinyl hydrolase 1 n=1 Tax=Pleurotus ostreatus (strain PC15) TaxID=1137138 RepID=A0A067PCX2_PLEO1|nr:hypothetical protein PLEOSDRAFT_152885 [Pleurotus ostreatus PC15]
MPPKRRRRASPPAKGLPAGQKLQRNALATPMHSPWSWVDTEIQDVNKISHEHRLAACGFSSRNGYPFCSNKFSDTSQTKVPESSKGGDGNNDDNVIIVTDDESQPECSKKACKNNPKCLNYLGQETWVAEEGAAWKEYIKMMAMGEDPLLDSRDPDVPVGLKNLGATCYANAFLQVWFRDLAFRAGVYKCVPSEDTTEDKYKESPIFQLQYTFAALQECTQSVFNPTKLVESLQIRTAEQQDAQEFSKLFMSHLDAEFRKQAAPSLKSLVADQFEGKQVYGTVCDRCSYRSERPSTFLEIEINLEANSSLEERIEALLKPEQLQGDNRYLCPQCETLQEATRYTELRELPPVVHFSLLRFVYDVSSMERKKSKHAISFPKTLDMSRFLGSQADRVNNSTDAEPGSKTYNLRGILLHKGPSAYHGHYEAQVFDSSSNTWFQFNDEVVSKINNPEMKSNANGVADHRDKKYDIALALAWWLISRRMSRNALKRRRVDDSEDEIVVYKQVADPSVISSKDAYMLIYTCEGDEGLIPVPPASAMEQVKALNASHDQTCEAFQVKKQQAKSAFNDLRRNVVDIFKSWNVTSDSQPSIIASANVLKDWLAKHCIGASVQDKSKLQKQADDAGGGIIINAASGTWSLVTDDILCIHKRLDPTKASLMKQINQVAYQKIANTTNCVFEPTMTPSDVCPDCVAQSFLDRLYQIQHPKLVRSVDQAEDDLEEPGYWISKPWLRDWRLAKPKMHVQGEDDPSPDAPDYASDVRCEHGNLSMNTSQRVRIGAQAYCLLQELFPSWAPLSTNVEPCPICEAEIHESKEHKLAARKQAEDEKARLRHMYDNALNGNMALLEDVPCAIVPAQFIRSWRQWLSKPSEYPRPNRVDNTPFICTHGLLNFDANCPNDMDSSLSIIKMIDWQVLSELYTAEPVIAIEKRLLPDEQLPRRTAWTSTDITVRLLGKEDSQASKKPATYGSRQIGARLSKRLRTAKDSGEKRRFSITKETTVKDIKVMVQTQMSIPTICQRLFYRDIELEDNGVSVADLSILANDVLDLREESEVHDIDSDTEVSPPTKRKREEGGGFGGTLLGGHSSQPSSSREVTPQEDNFLSCRVCTFANAIDADACSMCNTPLS